MTNESESRWTAVETRDASKDGEFVYGVTTTGVYCKPSCASRRALRKNVRFYATPADGWTKPMRKPRRFATRSTISMCSSYGKSWKSGAGAA